MSSFGAWRIYMISCWRVGIKVPSTQSLIFQCIALQWKNTTLKPEKVSLGKNTTKTWNNIYQHPSTTKYKKTKNHKVTCWKKVSLNCLNKWHALRIMGSQNWWFGDPRPLLYTSKPLYCRVQWVLGWSTSSWKCWPSTFHHTKNDTARSVETQVTLTRPA